MGGDAVAQQPPSDTQIRVNDRQVQVWNDDLWRRLRTRDDICEEWLAEHGALRPFRPGGGKGGDLMAWSADYLFIVKQLNDGDHASLLRVTRSYVDHVLEQQSLLCTFYLHYVDMATGNKFVVMRNIMPPKGPYSAKYDLKGCADDKMLEAEGRRIPAVHKRIWHLHMWGGECCWTEPRVTYFRGKQRARSLKIRVTEDQQAKTMKRLEADVKWLTSQNLMDYSLMVGFRRIPKGSLASDADIRWALHGPPSSLRQPMLQQAEGDVVGLVYMGIIDFLQPWNTAKQIAACVKVLERNKPTIPPRDYGERFLQHFGRQVEGGAAPVEARVEPLPADRPQAAHPPLPPPEERKLLERAEQPALADLKTVVSVGCQDGGCRDNGPARLLGKRREVSRDGAGGCLCGLLRLLPI